MFVYLAYSHCSWIYVMTGLQFIGANLSEPHTSESNGGFFIYMHYLLHVFLMSVWTVI